MFRFIVVAILSLGTSYPCFSRDIPKNIEFPFGIEASPAMVYAGCGNVHLLLEDYELALEDFRRATFFLEYCEHPEVTEFLILFGQIVAYDNLHLRDKCEQALGSLILSVNNADEEEEEEEETDEDLDRIFIESTKMIKKIASLAPSEDIREILISFVEELQE